MFTLGYSESSFLEEGIACAMDSLWWGIDNTAWVSYYRRTKACPSVLELLCLPRDDFYMVEDYRSYPLAGSFVRYLLSRFGRETFKQLYLVEDYNAANQDILCCSLSDVEKDFFQYIDLLTYDQAVYARIEDLLKEEQ